jgi:predicted transcriptional regulator
MSQRSNEVINLQDAILDLIDETHPPVAITALMMTVAYLIAEMVSRESIRDAVSTAQGQIAELVEKYFKEIEADRKMWN